MGRRAAGRPSLSERAERVSFDGRPLKTHSLQPERGPPGRLFGVPFFGRSKKGDPRPGNCQIHRSSTPRSRTQRSPDRRVSAVHATVGEGLSSDGKRPFVIRNRRHALRFACYTGRFTGRTTSEPLPLTLDTVLVPPLLLSYTAAARRDRVSSLCCVATSAVVDSFSNCYGYRSDQTRPDWTLTPSPRRFASTRRPPHRPVWVVSAR